MAKKKEFISNNEVFEMERGYKDESGIYHKTFELEEIGGAEEEAISKAEIKQNGAKIIRTLLAMCCTRIGDISRDDVKKDKWISIIQSLDVGDQDIMLLRLREISKGNEIEVEHKCPNPECGKKLTTIIETSELEIVPYDGEEVIDFELPRGFKDREGNYHTKGKIRRPIGLDREILDPISRNNIGRANTLMLTRCILEVEGMKNITDADVRNLKTRDREYLYKLLVDKQYGVKLTADLICPYCAEEFTGNLNMVNFI